MSTLTTERALNPFHVTDGADFRRDRVGDRIGDLSFDVNEAVRLAELPEDQRQQELIDNLRGFRDEVLNDQPVSHLYHYYYDGGGNVYNHPDRQPIHRFENQFDPRERDGLPAEGFKKAAAMMFENPDTTALWYSPSGRATLDEDPENPYADVTFIYGQLYVMSYDGEKINGVAVKVDREGEQAIEQFMPDQFVEANKKDSDCARIEYFLQNPVQLAGNVEEITTADWKDGQVYGGKEGGVTQQEFTVKQLMADLRRRFAGEKLAGEDELSRIVKGLRTEQLADKQEIAKIYLTMILNHPTMQKDGKISLMGACGGNNATRSEIEALLGGNQIDPLASQYRLATQGDQLQQLLKGLPGTNSENEHFVCPECGYQATGPVGNECPGCHITKDEYAKKTGAEVCDENFALAA